MGATCGTIGCIRSKESKHPNRTIIKRPTPIDFSADDDNEIQDERIVKPPENEEARLGVSFQFDELIKILPTSQKNQAIKTSRLDKWFKMVTFGLDQDLVSKVIIRKNKTPYEPIVFSKFAKIGLSNFYETYPKLFMSRLSKGPPPQYRWLAWKLVAGRKLKKAKGVYEELLTKGNDSPWMHDIMKDLDRTFPTLPFYNKEQYGDVGQRALMNVLKAFSVYDEKVGYCQSMNFLIGFILLMSGGNERESFWLFAALTKISNLSNDQPKFDGLRGFYKKNFPLLQQYFYQFEAIFQELMPELYQHFYAEVGIPNLLWLQKWFQSLYLYSFPLGLCIRIWDNIFVYGTEYLFSVAIAILKLTEKDLLQCDISGINDYFKAFKDEEVGQRKLLPPWEDIITESLKIKIPEERLSQLKNKYQWEVHPKKVEKKQKIKKLAIVNQDAIQQREQQKQVEIKQLQQQQNLIPRQYKPQIEEEKLMDLSDDKQEEQQAKSSENKQIGGSSSGGANFDLSAGGEKKSHFLPQLVNYDDMSKKSMKAKMNSTKNLNGGKRPESASGHLSVDDLKLPPIAVQVNRNYMIFGTVQNDKSLTHKQSSENFSVTQSIHQSESEQVRGDPLRNIPPAHLIKVGKNGEPQMIVRQISIDQQSSNTNGDRNQQQQYGANKKQVNNQIYYKTYQKSLLKSLNYQKDSRHQHHQEKVKEDSLEYAENDDVDYSRQMSSRIENSRVDYSMQKSNKYQESSGDPYIHRRRGFEAPPSLGQSRIHEQQNEDNLEHSEIRDVVENMSQNGDHVSQASINRGGESDHFTSDSNKFNLPDIKKPPYDPDINSENFKNLINNLPH